MKSFTFLPGGIVAILGFIRYPDMLPQACYRFIRYPDMLPQARYLCYRYHLLKNKMLL